MLQTMQWRTHLRTLLGQDANALQQMDDLLILRDALEDDSLSVADRLIVLNWIDRLDSTQQTFLLPWLAPLLFDPAPTVRQQAARSIDDLMGGACTSLLDRVVRLPDPMPGELVTPILKDIEALLLDHPEIEPDIPFFGLLLVRTPLAVLAILLALTRWLNQPEWASRRGELQTFFQDDVKIPQDLIRLLDRWATQGPQMLRYLIVQWVGAAECTPSLELSVAEFLLDRYARDEDPIVSAAAIQAWTETVSGESAALEQAVRQLRHELGTLSRRRLSWEGWDPGLALRIVSIGILGALGRLAVDRFPADAPLEALIDLVQIQPASHRTRPEVCLSFFRSDLDVETRDRCLESALLLFPNELLVEVEAYWSRGRVVTRLSNSKKQLSNRQYPGRILDSIVKEEGHGYFWARPVRAEAKSEAGWFFHLVAIANSSDAPARPDLLGLISPAIWAFANARPKKISYPLQDRLHREFDQRGPWMIITLEAVARIVRKAMDQGMDLRNSRVSQLFRWLEAAGLSSTITRGVWDLSPGEWSTRKHVKDRVRRLFLQNLAEKPMFEALFPGGQARWPANQMLNDLALAVIRRSLPGSVSYRWIEHNFSVLHGLAVGAGEIRITAAARTILHFHRRHFPVSFLEEEAPLTVAEVLEGSLPVAVCFSQRDDVERQLAELEMRTDHTGSARAEQQWMALRCEVVAKWLEQDASLEPIHPEHIEHAAAGCLAQGRLEPLSRLRLFEAFARVVTPLSGSVQRLYDELLRTSVASELALFLRVRTDEGALHDDPALFGRLIQMLMAPAERLSRRQHGRQIDLMGISDQAVHRSLLLDALYREALAPREQFLRTYLAHRGAARLPSETHTVMPVQGKVYATASEKGDGERFIDLRPLTREGRSLADTVASPLPAFLYQADDDETVRGLCCFHLLPDGAFDLFDTPMSEQERQSWLAEQLAARDTLRLLSRVVALHPDGVAEIDLGACVPGLPARWRLSMSDLPREDDFRLVEVRKTYRSDWALAETGLALVYEPYSDIPQLDLLEHPDATEQLRQYEGEQRPVAVRTRVIALTGGQDGRVLCTLETGFSQLENGMLRHLSVALTGADAEFPPEPGTRLWLELREMRFTPLGRSVTYDVHEAQSGPPALAPGRVIAAVLLSTREPAHGLRRSWRVQLGAHDYPLDRRALTSDLQQLFALDALQDNHPTLERLKSEPVLLLVEGYPNRLSVLAAPAGWSASDLILGVSSRHVKHITLISRTSDGRMRFELGRTPVRNLELDSSPLSPVGEVAEIEPGELFDQAGRPVEGRNWKSGTRLVLEVVDGVLQRDGTLLVPGQGPGTHVGSDRTLPFLRILAVDDSNPAFQKRFRVHESIQALAREANGTLELRLAGGPVGFPEIRISPADENEERNIRGEISRRSSAPGAEVGLEVVVDAEWKPESLEYCLRVRLPAVIEFPLEAENPADQVRGLLDLERGHVLISQRNMPFGREGARLVGRFHDQKVEMDPLIFHLLPEPPGPHDLNRSSLSAALLVTDASPLNPTDRSFVLDGSASPVPCIHEQQHVYGLVVSTPVDQKLLEFEVQWLAELKGGRSQCVLSARQRYQRPGQAFKISTGELVRASESKGVARLEVVHRYLSGTFVFKRVRVDDVPEEVWRTRDNQCHAVLLRTDEKGLNWLFAFYHSARKAQRSGGPAEPTLVEIPSSRIGNIDLLRSESVWSLDRVTFVVSASTAHSQQGIRFNVLKVVESPLRTALLRRLELDRIRSRDQGKVWATLHFPGGGENLPSLPLSLARADLPTFRPLERLSRDPILPCTMVAYELEIIELDLESSSNVGGKGYAFQLVPQLKPWNELEKQAALHQKRDLLTELRSRRRVESVGTVQPLGSSLQVQLNEFRHRDPIPMPLTEESWLRFEEHVVTRECVAKLVVALDDRGQPFASLIRFTPPDLKTWLRLERITEGEIDSLQLYYYGELDAREREACGLPACSSEVATWEAEDAPVEVLFEVNPRERRSIYFLATVSQLRYQGQRLTPKSLQRGDRITRFRVTRAREDGAPRLELISVAPDLLTDLESFHEKGGVLFAQVRSDGNALHIDWLHGADFSPRPVTARRRRNWQLELEQPADRQEWLARLADCGQVYVRFSRADRENSVLYFRVLEPDEIFRAQNLIYVRTQEVMPHGRASLKLVVQSLDSRVKGDVYISDNVFSARRGQLARGDFEEIYLAQVMDASGAEQGIPLSLVGTPPRPFGHLMHQRDTQQAIFKRWAGKKLVLEVTPGVNVGVPLDRLEGLKKAEDLEFGAILVLRPLQNAHRVRLEHVVPGQLTYLELERAPSMLVDLWGEESYRRPRVEQRKPLDCSLVGLSQLRGSALIRSDAAFARGLVPLTMERLDKGGKDVRVVLQERTSSTERVGRIELENGRPMFRTRDRDFPLKWADVTVLEGTLEALAARAQSWKWRDLPPTETQSNLTFFNGALVIASVVGRDELSLVDRARFPMPVDHLIEQFPFAGKRIAGRKGGGNRLRSGPIRLMLTVAEADSEGIVLEIAPGRFAEVPTRMLRPLHADSYRPGLEQDWSGLRMGDSVKLELLPGRATGGGDFLPNPRVVSVTPGRRRHLQRRVVTRLTQAEGTQMYLGPSLAGGIPVEGLEWLLEEAMARRPRRDVSAAGEDPAVRAGEVSGLVRLDRDELAPHSGNPLPGDSVMVYRDEGGRICACGFEALTLAWTPDPRDPLNLHDSAERTLLFDLLLCRPDQVLWATVERIDEEGRLLFLSRAGQLQGLLPARGKVVRCQVRAEFTQNRLLVDILGTPYLIDAEAFCLGQRPPLRAFAELLISTQEGRELEVTLGEGGGLSAVAVYQPPKAHEFEAAVEHVAPIGLLARAGGCRIFVPAREAVWTRLDDELLPRLYKKGNRIRLARLENSRGELFSLLRTSDVLREVDLLQKGEAPAFVSPQWVDPDKKWAIVRGRSGVMMELELRPEDPPFEQTIAYFRHIDHRGRRLILSLHVAPDTRWDLPALTPETAIDELTPQVVLARSAALGTALEVGTGAAADAWLAGSRALAPSPRNLRLLLNRSLPGLGLSGQRISGEQPDGSPGREMPWSIWAAADPGLSTFHAVWVELARIFSGEELETHPSWPVRFAIGYRALIQRRYEEAFYELEQIGLEGAGSFDVQVCLAYALFRLNRRQDAMQVLKRLTDRLWVNASYTLPFPIVPPPAVRLRKAGGNTWQEALEQGNREEIALLVRQWEGEMPNTVAVQSQLIWLALSRGGSLEDLNGLVISFCHYIQCEELFGRRVAPEYYLLAARMSFAQGKTLDGWRYLERCGDKRQPGPAVARLWRAWLEGTELRDEPLFGALLILQRQTRWRRHVSDEAMEALWKAFQTSPLHLQLPRGPVRVVAELPTEIEGLKAWIERYGAQAVEDVLTARLEFGATEGARE